LIPSATTPTRRPSAPSCRSGRPPGSPGGPSVRASGRAACVALVSRPSTDELGELQRRRAGPLGASTSPGLILLDSATRCARRRRCPGREEAPVIGLAIAAFGRGDRGEQAVEPRRARAPLRTSTVAGRAVIWKTASTLPTRSTTATVAGRAARLPPRPPLGRSRRCTSVSERKVGPRQAFGAQGGEWSLLEAGAA